MSLVPLHIDAEVLRAMGIEPASPVTTAMLILAKRYGLDPILGQITIIRPAKGPARPYITHGGMLAVAHASGQLNGIEVLEDQTREHGWSVTVAVRRKDMDYPFVYKGGCGRNEPIAIQGHGPEMALARAERRALTRAFAIEAVGFVVGENPDVRESALEAETAEDRSLRGLRDLYAQTRELLTEEERLRMALRVRDANLPPRGQWSDQDYETALALMSEVRRETAALDANWRQSAQDAQVTEAEIVEGDDEG